MKASHTNNPNRSAEHQRETHYAKPSHGKRTKKLYLGMRGSSMDLSRNGPDGWMGKPLVRDSFCIFITTSEWLDVQGRQVLYR